MNSFAGRVVADLFAVGGLLIVACHRRGRPSDQTSSQLVLSSTLLLAVFIAASTVADAALNKVFP